MAITSATYQAYEKIGPSTYRVKIRLVDATLPGGFDDVWMMVSGNTVPELAEAASRQIADLIKAKASGDLLAGIAVGTAISINAPAETNVQAYVRQANQLVRLKSWATAGVTSASLTTKINALTSALNAIDITSFASQL